MILYLKKSFGLQGFHKKIQRFKGYCLDIAAFQCWVFGHSTSPFTHFTSFSCKWVSLQMAMCRPLYDELSALKISGLRMLPRELKWHRSAESSDVSLGYLHRLGPMFAKLTWLTLPLSNHMTESVNHHPPFSYEMRLKTRHSFCCNSTVRMLWHVQVNLYMY